jgi:predicted O-linked N-acetylglucosamine transferase (SPINDLY family)
MAVSDVILDTIHFGGFNTSLEAFAVGTPVVTWPGKFQRSRHTAALYKEMGILDCIADSPARYIEIAVRLGTDSTYREKIKKRILANNHRLFEDHRVVKEYERFFLETVKNRSEPAVRRSRKLAGRRRLGSSG